MAPQCEFGEDVFGAYEAIIGETVIGLWVMSTWSWRITLEIPSFRSGKAKNLVQEYALYAKALGYDPIGFATIVGWLNGIVAAGLVWAIVNPNFQLQSSMGGVMLLLSGFSIYCRRAVGDGWEKCYDAIVLFLMALAITVSSATALSKGCYAYAINGVDHGFRLSCGYTVVSAIVFWGFKSLAAGDLTEWEKFLDEEDEAPAEGSLSEFFFGVSKTTEAEEALLA
jgi:hypothetical protein